MDGGAARTAPVTKLPAAFYDRPGVVPVARQLLGKILVTEFGGQRTSGRIVETEAYNGVGDRASHAWSGRRTRRTEVMYGVGGAAYVYLIYGIHHLFNVVTNKKDVPHAVLVRALDPLEGIPVMLERTGKGRQGEEWPDGKPDYSLTRGPGNLSRALGLLTLHTGFSLLGDRILDPGMTDGGRSAAGLWLRQGSASIMRGADAVLPYRFFIKGSPWVMAGRAEGAVIK